MRGPKPKYLIQLFDNQIAELRQLVSSCKAPQGKVMRARIILAAHEHPEWSNQEIAHQVGCTDRVVRRSVFPPKCELKPRRWLAACRRRREARSDRDLV